MKYLRRCKSHEEYASAYPEIKDQEFCVSVVEDSCNKAEGEKPDELVFFKDPNYNAWAGDLLCWDTEKDDWTVYKVVHNSDSDETPLVLPSNLVPDAVCVVPACHTENGKARWCALKDVNNGEYFAWNQNNKSEYYNKIIEELPCYTSAPLAEFINIDNDYTKSYFNNKFNGHFTVAHYLIPISEEGSIMDCCTIGRQYDMEEGNEQHVHVPGCPPNIFSNLKHTTLDADDEPILDDNGEIDFPSGDHGHLLWPYANDGFGKNTDAFLCPPSTMEGQNWMCDLNGLENTQILLKIQTQSNTLFPAAMAAAQYSQNVWSDYTWYLPAVGELIYFYAKWYSIQHTLYRLHQANATLACPLDTNYGYWSST